LWHPIENALYWIDFYGPYVYRQKQGAGPVERWRVDRGETIGSLVFADEGLLLLAVDHGLYLFDTGTGATRFFGDPKNGRTDLAYNDGKVDRAGRYWIGTYNLAEEVPNGILYRLGANGRAKVADEGFVICNGPAFSPDCRKMYFSDTVGRRILSYDIDEDGAISGRRIHFSFSTDDGMPDGLTVDSDGNIWCALYGGSKVVCIDDTGVLKQSIPVPTALVTSLCFGGAGLKTLYVTTGRSGGVTDGASAQDKEGAVFMRQVDRPGLPEPVFTL
jgi:sugar lactone lactonase YvrE